MKDKEKALTQTSVVILSTGRTGTMFLANLLRDLLPQATVYHEAGERSRLINIFTHAYMSGILPADVPRWAWRRVVKGDLEKNTQPLYIDSNNQLYAFVPLSYHLYPELHVIHLLRDPRDYVRSHINWARYRFRSFIANYLIPFWQPNAWLLGKMSFVEWVQLSRFERYCWIWDFKNRFIGQMEDSNTPYLRIYFEDIFHNPDPIQSINQILAFLGLADVAGIEERFQHPVNPAKGKSFPSWSHWTPKHCKDLHRLCGQTMQIYGYGNEITWREKIAGN